MTRKVYIADVDGDAENCADRIKRKSEDRIHVHILRKEDLVKYELMKEATNDNLLFFVPFLNQYQGKALFVTSNYQPKVDVDLFFSRHTHDQLGSILYFIKHDAWLIDCSDINLKILNPNHINTSTPNALKKELTISIIDNI